ncbi:MAG: hypothetical protein A2020_13300 [Lentisphaerae bacterium GWF2_45_14]|nr:MAG: hypothetical protein A2020_13300 [Lentisphaerae bacterium GWF2_45_14]
MDVVKVNCPYCAKELEINAEFAGEKAPCPFCGEILTFSAPMLAGEPVNLHKNCPFCGEKVLEAAKKCKHCGEFIENSGEYPIPEKILWSEHPKILSFPIPLFIGIILLPVGIGFIIIGVLLLKVHSTKYLITDRKIRLESGVFIKEAHEIRLKDIKAISLRKDFQDTIAGTGSILISPAGISGYQLGLRGVSDPERVNTIINDARDRLVGMPHP